MKYKDSYEIIKVHIEYKPIQVSTMDHKITIVNVKFANK